MPAKGKRVASRQAQLNRRRRRQGRVGADSAEEAVERGGAPATTSVAAPARAVAAGDREGNASTIASPQAATAAPAASERPAAAGRGIQSLAYNHLGRELRRILILAGILLVVLFVISFLI
ncbi:MAG: hypothetical protein OXI91_07295 [Chloroflexota bacterium]|nr:hypothetical protein [Chloroflexota bacterium]